MPELRPDAPVPWAPDAKQRETLLYLAQKYIWWQPPERIIGSPLRIVMQAMRLATFEDTMGALRSLGDAILRRALLEAYPGAFSPQAWSYWHFRLDVVHPGNEIPPLPKREFV